MYYATSLIFSFIFLTAPFNTLALAILVLLAAKKRYDMRRSTNFRISRQIQLSKLLRKKKEKTAKTAQEDQRGPETSQEDLRGAEGTQEERRGAER